MTGRMYGTKGWKTPVRQAPANRTPQEAPDEAAWLTMDQAIRQTGLTRQRIMPLIKDQTITAHKEQSRRAPRWMIKQSDLARWRRSPQGTGPTVTTGGAARLLGVSDQTILQMVKRGELAARKIEGNGGQGHIWAYSRSDIEKLQDERRTESPWLPGYVASEMIGIEPHGTKILRPWLERHGVPYHEEAGHGGWSGIWLRVHRESLSAVLADLDAQATLTLARCNKRARAAITVVLNYYDVSPRRIFAPFGPLLVREAKCVVASLLLDDLGMGPTAAGKTLQKHHSTVMANAATARRWDDHRQEGLLECRRLLQEALEARRKAS